MIDFDTIIRDLTGTPLREPDAPPYPGRESRIIDVKLARVAANAALAIFPDEKIPAAEHVRRFSLAQKLMAGGSHVLPAEDVVFLKERIARAFSPLIAGQSLLLLDPPAGA